MLFGNPDSRVNPGAFAAVKIRLKIHNETPILLSKYNFWSDLTLCCLLFPATIPLALKYKFFPALGKEERAALAELTQFLDGLDKAKVYDADGSPLYATTIRKVLALGCDESEELPPGAFDPEAVQKAKATITMIDKVLALETVQTTRGCLVALRSMLAGPARFQNFLDQVSLNPIQANIFSVSKKS